MTGNSNYRKSLGTIIHLNSRLCWGAK